MSNKDTLYCKMIFSYVKAVVFYGLFLTINGIVFANDDVSVRISEIEVTNGYMFARAEFGSLISGREKIIDTLVSTNLAEHSWVWVDANYVGAGTNSAAFLFILNS